MSGLSIPHQLNQHLQQQQLLQQHQQLQQQQQQNNLPQTNSMKVRFLTNNSMK